MRKVLSGLKIAWTFAIHQPHYFGVTYIIHVIIIKLTIW